MKNILKFVNIIVDKLLESVNEKFTEESDPVHDLGIGISNIIKKSRKIIYDLISNTRIYIYTDSNRPDKGVRPISPSNCLQYMRVYEDLGKHIFHFQYYSDRYFNKDKNPVNKIELSKYLLKKANILDCMTEEITTHPSEPFEDEYDFFGVSFVIKSEYVKYFSDTEF